MYDEEANDISILGYFTLSLKVFKIPNEFSGNKRKKIDGLSATCKGEKIKDCPCILIGQFARNDIFEDFNGLELMHYCFKKIYEGQSILSGRVILLECKNISKLIEFYLSFGFKQIKKEYKSDELIQLYRIIE